MRILIADDDKVNRLILETFLKKWGYDVVTAQDGIEAWNLLEQPEAPRLAILDWMMPGMDGAQVCQRVRQQQKTLYTYIILLTSKGQKQDIVEGFEAGADDYITKPFDANELRSRLRAGFRILELEEQLVQARDLLQVQATHDGLTGLWNRATILDTLGRELARAQRERSSVGVILADLDHFKRVNDTYGHLAGDIVLREVTQRMRRSVRTYDAIGRYGGEEFLVVVPQSDLSSAVRQAERLRRQVGETRIGIPDGSITVTISMGVAGSGKVQGTDAESLLREADEALYRAKEGGRNRVESAPIGQSPSASDRQTLLEPARPPANRAS